MAIYAFQFFCFWAQATVDLAEPDNAWAICCPALRLDPLGCVRLGPRGRALCCATCAAATAAAALRGADEGADTSAVCRVDRCKLPGPIAPADCSFR